MVTGNELMMNSLVTLQELYYFGCLLLLFVNFILQTIVAGRVLPSVDPKQLDKILLIIYGSCVIVFHVVFVLRVCIGVCTLIIVRLRVAIVVAK